LEAQNVFKGSQDYESLVLVYKPFFFCLRILGS
jgi:hypothetical protein